MRQAVWQICQQSVSGPAGAGRVELRPQFKESTRAGLLQKRTLKVKLKLGTRTAALGEKRAQVLDSLEQGITL